MAEVLEQNRDREKTYSKDITAGPFQSGFSGQHTEEKAAMGALESALAAAEEDLDVLAAKTAKAEAVADLAEFDENIPLEEADKDDTQVSKAEQEVQNLIAQVGRTFFKIVGLVRNCLGFYSFFVSFNFYVTCHIYIVIYNLYVKLSINGSIIFHLADSNRTICDEVRRGIRRCVLRGATGRSRTGTRGAEEGVGVRPVAGIARGGGTPYAARRRR